MRILVVDDDERVRNALTVFVESHDDFVLAGEAANGAQAVELCQRLQPDVVLMDLVMPIMDGATATGWIHESFPHIRIIILTNSLEMEPIEAALQAGASTFLPKSVSVKRLAETLRSAHRSSGSLLTLPQPMLRAGADQRRRQSAD
jgi:NarL family two-component system response regulator LiaR